MNVHEKSSDLLPQYAAGQLEEIARREVDAHLKDCPECRADLALWQDIGAAVVAADQDVPTPRGLAERALEHLRAPQVTLFQRAWQILWAQAPLIQRELWPAVALVMVMGFLVAVLVNKAAALRVVAPLVAAASLAVIYGPEHDPAAELALSTPTSPWKVLLARVTLVFGYNLLLALAASLLLLAFLPAALADPASLSRLILAWLAPMTFLSAAALALSLWVGTANALLIAYVAWLAQFLPTFTHSIAAVDGFTQAMLGYARFWQSPLALLAAGGLLFAAALWLAQSPARGLRLRA